MGLAVCGQNGKLHITKEANGSNPVRAGLKPLLGFDVWEHAYYLDYQNRRADHVNKLWEIIDWDVVENDCNSEVFTTEDAEDTEFQIREKNEFDSGVLCVFCFLCTTLCLLRGEIIPDLLFLISFSLTLLP